MKQIAQQLVMTGIIIILPALILRGQNNQQQDEAQALRFTIEKQLPATPVKNQYRTNTCWSFASASFMESELLRTGKGEVDLSEMFFIREAYLEKAEKYVRLHGMNTFGEGGLVMDVMDIWKTRGAVPQPAYEGLFPGDSLPVHGEFFAVLKGYLDQVITNPDRRLSPVWKKGFEGILDAYLGKLPTRFEYQGESFTPLTFAGSLGLDPDDYMAIGSFTHHPYYEDFILEVPDNWHWSTIQNVPLPEMMEILEHALSEGYSACWDADDSEKGFDRKRSVALLPDPARPEKEQVITQVVRQQAFDNYLTTDDHLMHITGLARDQHGKRFYLVKNSWGTRGRKYNGYLYVSEAYMQAKTLFILVHKDAIPVHILEKMGL